LIEPPGVDTVLRTMRSPIHWSLACAALAVLACSKDEEKAAQVDAAPPAPSVAATTVPSAPAPSASAAAPPVECPKGSTGDGTFSKPCEAKGTARMMDATWTGKTDDKGPFFKVTNKAPQTILYGKIAVYFYDKAGKQLDAKDGKPYMTCGGNMFGGVMKAQEKATIQFSCVKKDDVPDKTSAIETEMQMVGFADESEKKVASYWRNTDLTPDARKKGGVK
jgi:hypothetical protein